MIPSIEPGYARRGKYHSTYISYKAMKSRCKNHKRHEYKNYGARGIRVCDRWLGTDGFIRFVEDMGIKPFGTSIDRINTNGDYKPSNCRWATRRQQNNNTRVTIVVGDGSLKQYCEHNNLNYNTIYGRIYNHGWDILKAISTPIDLRYRHINGY